MNFQDFFLNYGLLILLGALLVFMFWNSSRRMKTQREEQAQKAAPPGTSLADIVSATGSRVIHAADTILAATQPPSVIDQLTDEMATQVQRTVTHDHANELAAHASTRPASQHPKPLPTPAMARTASAPAR